MSEEAPAIPADIGPVDIATGTGKVRAIDLSGPTSPANITTDEAGNIKDQFGNLTGENLFGHGAPSPQDALGTADDTPGEPSIGPEGPSPLSAEDHAMLSANPTLLKDLQRHSGVRSDEELAAVLSDARGVVQGMSPRELAGLEELGIGGSAVVVTFLSRLSRESKADQQALVQAKARIAELEQRSESSDAPRQAPGGEKTSVGDLDGEIDATWASITEAKESGNHGRLKAAEARLARLQRSRFS